MKKTHFALIILILLGSVAVGALILRTKPAAPATAESKEAAEKGEHGAAGGKEEKKADDDDDAPKVKLTAKAIKDSGVKLEEAGAATIKTTLPLFGKIGPNEEAMARVSARFAGVVKQVRKRLGDPVKKGETLAVVESNDSLRSFEVKSEIDGTVIRRDVAVGEVVGDQTSLFTVADLRTVWVDLSVYSQDFEQLKIGQRVLIDTGSRASAGGVPARLDERAGTVNGNADAAGGGGSRVESTVAYLSPFGAENTQSMLARVVVPNPEGRLRLGLFVTGQIVLDEAEAPVAVRAAALQTLEQKPVVFVQEGDAFEARTVELGRRDDDWVEIVSGVLPGEKYVSANSFILKAEIGKAAAKDDD